MQGPPSKSRLNLSERVPDLAEVLAESRNYNARIGRQFGCVIGSIAGTWGGYEFRTRLVKAIGGKDLPIGLLENVIAIGGAFLIVTRRILRKVLVYQ